MYCKYCISCALTSFVCLHVVCKWYVKMFCIYAKTSAIYRRLNNAFILWLQFLGSRYILNVFPFYCEPLNMSCRVCPRYENFTLFWTSIRTHGSFFKLLQHLCVSHNTNGYWNSQYYTSDWNHFQPFDPGFKCVMYTEVSKVYWWEMFRNDASLISLSLRNVPNTISILYWTCFSRRQLHPHAHLGWPWVQFPWMNVYFHSCFGCKCFRLLICTVLETYVSSSLIFAKLS